MTHPQEHHQDHPSDFNLQSVRGNITRVERRPLWSIILAGGNGVRLRPLIRRWLNCDTPKQYCAFIGAKSMLQHTLDRAEHLSPQDKQITVITRPYLGMAQLQIGDRAGCGLIEQPSNRDTAAGIFLPLAHVMARDPDATVVIYPSDHFIYPERPFLEAVQSAAQVAEQMPDYLVLLGAQPDRAEREYGWIEPDAELDMGCRYKVRSIGSFVEKPSRTAAERCFAAGGLWNTMVIAAKLRALWQLGRRYFPALVALFDKLREAIGGPHEKQVLEDIYRDVPAFNFSSQLLARAMDRSVVVTLHSVLWCDWGSPERIVETLRRIGRQPAFPMKCLEPTGGVGRPAKDNRPSAAPSVNIITDQVRKLG